MVATDRSFTKGTQNPATSTGPGKEFCARSWVTHTIFGIEKPSPEFGWLPERSSTPRYVLSLRFPPPPTKRKERGFLIQNERAPNSGTPGWGGGPQQCTSSQRQLIPGVLSLLRDKRASPDWLCSRELLWSPKQRHERHWLKPLWLTISFPPPTQTHRLQLLSSFAFPEPSHRPLKENDAKAEPVALVVPGSGSWNTNSWKCEAKESRSVQARSHPRVTGFTTTSKEKKKTQKNRGHWICNQIKGNKNQNSGHWISNQIKSASIYWKGFPLKRATLGGSQKRKPKWIRTCWPPVGPELSTPAL